MSHFGTSGDDFAVGQHVEVMTRTNPVELRRGVVTDIAVAWVWVRYDDDRTTHTVRPTWVRGIDADADDQLGLFGSDAC